MNGGSARRSSVRSNVRRRPSKYSSSSRRALSTLRGETRFLGSFPEDPARRAHASDPEAPAAAVLSYERMLEQVDA